MARAELTTSAQPFFVIVQWTASAYRAIKINQDLSLTGGFMANGAFTNDPPVAIRPMALSIRMRNSSVFTAQQGVIRVLSTPQQLEYDFSVTGGAVSQTFYDELTATMNNHPGVKSYTAHDFATTKRFISAPASQVGFKNYYTWENVGGMAVMANAFKQTAAAAPMNVTIFQFSSVSTPNVYDFVTHTLDAARLPVNTLYSQLAKEPQPAQEQPFQEGVQHVQRAAGSALAVDMVGIA